MTTRPHPLLTSERIGLVGDIDGDVDMLSICLDRLRVRGCEAVVQLGDLGLVWPDEDMDATLGELDERLAREGQVLYLVDGNHDDHARLNAMPVADDGVRWVRPRFGHLPRGWRGTHSTGLEFGALGGASSIDRADRVEGVDWWPDENVTEAQVDSLGLEPLDVLFGHDVPRGVRVVTSLLDDGIWQWTKEDLEYAAYSRGWFQLAVMRTQPRFTFGAHYGIYAEQDIVTVTNRSMFETHATVLADAREDATCCAVFDTVTLEVKAFRP